MLEKDGRPDMLGMDVLLVLSPRMPVLLLLACIMRLASLRFMGKLLTEGKLRWPGGASCKVG